MSSISYEHNDGDVYVTEVVETETQTARIKNIAHSHVNLSIGDGQVANDGTDTETVTVEIVDGLEVARGTDPSNATVLDLDATATLTVDGVAVDVPISSGSGSKDLTTTKPAGSTIEVEAVGLDAGPIDQDSAEIEVVSA